MSFRIPTGVYCELLIHANTRNGRDASCSRAHDLRRIRRMLLNYRVYVPRKAGDTGWRVIYRCHGGGDADSDDEMVVAIVMFVVNGASASDGGDDDVMMM